MTAGPNETLSEKIARMHKQFVEDAPSNKRDFKTKPKEEKNDE